MKTPLNTWISVKDAMPRVSKKIHTVKTANYETKAYCSWSYFIENGRSSRKKVFRYPLTGEIMGFITHWMLLSKPTK